MTKLLPGIFVLFLSVAALSNVKAQDASCTQKLRLATSTYDQGRLHELEGLLQPCLESGGFSQSEKVSAYKFLILAYIYLEEPVKADAAMLKLLQTDNYFEINEQVDPAEFIALYNTFRTWEVYRLGMKLGANRTNANVIASNNATAAVSKFGVGYGFSASFAAEIPLYKISKRLTFSPELQIQLSKLSNKSKGDLSTGPTTSKGPVTNAMGPQSLSYLSVPLLVQFEFGDKNKMNNRNRKIRPYVTAGIAPDYLFGAKRSFDDSKSGFPQVQGSNASAGRMNSININAVVGAGFRMRVASGFFIAEARYKYGFNAVTTRKNIYADQTEVFTYKYADPIYKINSISLSVGYVQNFFNPKKLRARK